ncbi:unnamed protein product [Brassica rapa subsp. trilocularis]|uniref:(rape) hypothetical protein n=1 Tax=Brassica napus TaxID=3708 RepID=A0A816SJK7_BRANA|nr:unnamed protein product [Brassica napus]
MNNKRISFFTAFADLMTVHGMESLLRDPNPSSPANSEAARLFIKNKQEYNRRVMEIVEQSYVY